MRGGLFATHAAKGATTQGSSVPKRRLGFRGKFKRPFPPSLFHRPRPSTPCHPAPAGARARACPFRPAPPGAPPPHRGVIALFPTSKWGDKTCALKVGRHLASRE